MLPKSQGGVEGQAGLSEKKMPFISGTILLVDDEEVIRRVGRKILERAGYKVITAKDGSECLKVFRQHADSISLIILDLNMPVMDGKETYFRLKSEFPAARVLISTGNHSDDELCSPSLNGPSGFLQKPYQVQQIIAKIDEVLKA